MTGNLRNKATAIKKRGHTESKEEGGEEKIIDAFRLIDAFQRELCSNEIEYEYRAYASSSG